MDIEIKFGYNFLTKALRKHTHMNLFCILISVINISKVLPDNTASHKKATVFKVFTELQRRR